MQCDFWKQMDWFYDHNSYKDMFCVNASTENESFCDSWYSLQVHKLTFIPHEKSCQTSSEDKYFFTFSATL